MKSLLLSTTVVLGLMIGNVATQATSNPIQVPTKVNARVALADLSSDVPIHL